MLGAFPIGSRPLAAATFTAGSAFAGARGVATVIGIGITLTSATGSMVGSSSVVGVSNGPPRVRVLDPDARVFTVEVTAALDDTGAETTFFLSDARFVTQPTDSPANVAFDESLRDPGSITISAFGDGRTGGGTRLALGEIRMANADGQYDGWLNYGFDGRQLVIRSGAFGAYPSTFSSVFSGTIEALTVNRSEVVIRMRDRQHIFDRPVLTTTYAGTNVLPDGIEGTANDIKGRVKPRLYGKVLNVSPPCVNTSKLAYQVSDGPVTSFDAIYDRGLALTPGVDHPTSAALLAATVAGGTYDTCLAEGLFRLGSSPAGAVTADATQGPSASDRTAAQILRSLALAAGVGAADISAADVAALETDSAAVLGLWLNAADSFTRVMDAVSGSVGAYYGFDPTGVFRMGRLTAPAGTPVLDLNEYDTFDLERRPARDGDVPTWAVTVRHSRVWTPQTNDLAGGVTDARRALLATEYRAERAEDATVKTKHLLAGEIVVDTLLTSATDAAAEAASRLDLHKVRRDFFDVTGPVDLLTESGVNLLDPVLLRSSRFDLADGRLFRLLGVRLETGRGRATMTLWG